MEEINDRLEDIEQRLLACFEQLKLTFILDVLADVRELRNMLKFSERK